MKTVFFTLCSKDLQNNSNPRNLDFVGFMNSFKKFHPDIDMKVYDETDLAKHGLNWYCAKAVFGSILAKEYDLVVNVDADTYFFDRLNEVLIGDYEIACPANFNSMVNVAIKTTSGLNGNYHSAELVSAMEYLQGGLIASTSKQFWEQYKYTTLKYYEKFFCSENDTLNLVAYLFQYELKILDGHLDSTHPLHTQWYGCSSLGKEKSAQVVGENIMIDNKKVKAYHFAHGGTKKKYTELFSPQVSNFIQNQIVN